MELSGAVCCEYDAICDLYRKQARITHKNKKGQEWGDTERRKLITGGDRNKKHIIIRGRNAERGLRGE